MNRSHFFVYGLLAAILFFGPSCKQSSSPMLPPPAAGLHYAKETPEMRMAVDKAFQAYYATPRPPNNLPERGLLELEGPIASYTLSADDVLGERGLKAPHLKNYGYFIKQASSGKVVGQVEIALSDQGKIVEQSGTIHEIDATALANMATIFEGLAQAESLEQARKGSFELSSLALPPHDAVPGGRFIASFVMWLKSDTSDGDLIFTFPPSRSVSVDNPPGLQPSTLYRAADMLKIIRPAVQKFQNSPASKQPHW